MLDHQGSEAAQLMGTKALVRRQLHGVEPILCHLVAVLDVHVGRLMVLVTEEENPKAFGA